VWLSDPLRGEIEYAGVSLAAFVIGATLNDVGEVAAGGICGGDAVKTLIFALGVMVPKVDGVTVPVEGEDINSTVSLTGLRSRRLIRGSV